MQNLKTVFWTMVVVVALVAGYLLATMVTDFLFGVGPLDFLVELIGIAVFAAVAAVVFLWLPGAAVKKILFRVLPGRRDPINRFMRLRYYAALVFLAFIGPHLWMSHHLVPLKRQFDAVAYGGNYGISPTDEVRDGRPVNETNFGGRLDDIVDKRIWTLLKYGFIPVFTARWEYKTNCGTSKPGVYIYTFLPRGTYRNLLLRVGGMIVGEKPTLEDRDQMDRDIEEHSI